VDAHAHFADRATMFDSILDLLYILNRYVHIVCTTVLVGGTLFCEFIVPQAIDELKREQQLSVFGRARWSFRALVWTCAILLVISGIVSSARRWQDYTGAQQDASRVPINAPEPLRRVASDFRRPGWWWAAHVSTGVVALCIAVSLMTVRRPPAHPLYWLRLSLIILLVVMFLATTARHMRLASYESTERQTAPGGRE
jgi:hypothetical protein